MKKLFILLTISIATVSVTAQVTPVVSKKEMKIEKHKEKKEEYKAKKEEKKEERKAMRKLEGSEVSMQAKEAFRGDFSDVSAVSWKRGPYYDEVTFTKDGVSQTAYYDFDAELVGTIIPKSFSALPASAQKWINKKYAAYQKVRTILFDDNEENESDIIMYGDQIDGSDMYFTELKKGNQTIILKVTTDGNVAFFKEMKN